MFTHDIADSDVLEYKESIVVLGDREGNRTNQTSGVSNFTARIVPVEDEFLVCLEICREDFMNSINLINVETSGRILTRTTGECLGSETGL